ncbi:MAG: Holliday junction resolvase, partial [Thermoplasmata archaeon]|nr:Holliday junction resolvase [Thermoplasmata archaeon]
MKASSTDTIRFSSASGRASEQLEAHRASVERVGLIVLYAYRRVGHRGGDPWRLYAAPGSTRPGTLNLLRRRLPEIARTREGNGVL